MTTSIKPQPTTGAAKKSLWKTFLKPSWVLMVLFVIAFSYFAFTVLAPWQLNKDDDIVHRNEQIAAAYEADPVPFADVTDDTGAIVGNNEWKRVILTGHYLPDDEVLLRLRPVASGPSYQSLVPFQIDGGTTVLVNRGWQPAGEGNVVPDIGRAPRETVTIEGMMRLGEAEHPQAPIVEDGYQQIYSISTEQISQLMDVDLANDYVQLAADEPGVLNEIPIPSMDRGNHLSYGFQWIAFGIMAPLGVGYLVWSEVREKRRFREEQAAMAAGSTDRDATPAGPAPDSAASTSTTEAAAETTGQAAAEATETSTPHTAAPADNAPGAPQAAADGQGDNKAQPRRRTRARYGDSRPDHYAKFNKKERF